MKTRLLVGLLLCGASFAADPAAGQTPRPAPKTVSNVPLMPVVGLAKTQLLRSLGASKGGIRASSTAQPQDCVNGTPTVQGIACGSTNSGQVANTDCFLTSTDPQFDHSYYDAYSFDGTSGQQVTITMSSSAFDTFLFLIDPSGSNTATTDHDGGGGTTSLIVFTLNQTGTWFIVANSWLGNQFGAYTLTLSCTGGASIIPVVGSTPGANDSLFRTSVQLHNGGSVAAEGRIVFHPSGGSASDSDPSLPYSLTSGQTQFILDLLPAMGRSGLGSADLFVTSGSVPVASVRVFNDAGEAGTTGFTEELLRSEEALQIGDQGVLLFPPDRAAFRFNIGIRTLGTGVTLMLTVRDPAGSMVATITRSFPGNYHEQQSAGPFLGGSDVPENGSVTALVTSGSAVFYGATVDNRTGDPSLQVARPTP